MKIVNIAEYRNLCAECGLNISRIDRLCFKTKILYYQNSDTKDKEYILNSALRQIGTNLTYIINQFWRMSIHDIIDKLKSNCIHPFKFSKGMDGRVFGTRNYNHIHRQLEKSRHDLFLRIIYIHNRISLLTRSTL